MGAGGASVFGLAAEMDVIYITLSLIAIIGFTIIFEFTTKRAETALHDTPYIEMLGKVYKEMMIMGLISFGIFMAVQAGGFSNEEILVAFEFAHILVFFSALCFVLQALCMMGLSQLIKNIYDQSAAITWEDLDGEYQICKTSWVFHFRWLPLCPTRSRIEFRILHNFFKHEYQLPPDFDFAAYNRMCLDHHILSLIEVGVGPWSVVIVLSLLYLGAYKLWVSQQDLDTCDTSSHSSESSYSETSSHSDSDYDSTDSTHRRWLATASSSTHSSSTDCNTGVTGLNTFTLLGWLLLLCSITFLIISRWSERRLIQKAGVSSTHQYGKKLHEMRDYDQKYASRRLKKGSLQGPIEDEGLKKLEELKNAAEGLMKQLSAHRSARKNVKQFMPGVSGFVSARSQSNSVDSSLSAQMQETIRLRAENAKKNVQKNKGRIGNARKSFSGAFFGSSGGFKARDSFNMGLTSSSFGLRRTSLKKRSISAVSPGLAVSKESCSDDYDNAVVLEGDRNCLSPVSDTLSEGSSLCSESRKGSVCTGRTANHLSFRRSISANQSDASPIRLGPISKPQESSRSDSLDIDRSPRRFKSDNSHSLSFQKGNLAVESYKDLSRAGSNGSQVMELSGLPPSHSHKRRTPRKRNSWPPRPTLEVELFEEGHQITPDPKSPSDVQEVTTPNSDADASFLEMKSPPTLQNGAWDRYGSNPTTPLSDPPSQIPEHRRMTLDELVKQGVSLHRQEKQKDIFQQGLHDERGDHEHLAHEERTLDQLFHVINHMSSAIHLQKQSSAASLPSTTANKSVYQNNHLAAKFVQQIKLSNRASPMDQLRSTFKGTPHRTSSSSLAFNSPDRRQEQRPLLPCYRCSRKRKIQNQDCGNSVASAFSRNQTSTDEDLLSPQRSLEDSSSERKSALHGSKSTDQFLSNDHNGNTQTEISPLPEDRPMLRRRTTQIFEHHQFAKDLSEIYLFESPKLFHKTFEIQLLLFCIYLALYVSNFSLVAGEEENAVAAQLAILVPLFLIMVIQGFNVKISSLLLAVSRMEPGIITEIIERTLDTQSLTEDIRKLIQDQIDQGIDFTAIYDDFDEDCNGSISFQEFRAGLHKRDIHISSGRAKRVFNMFGANKGKGVITREQFHRVIFHEGDSHNGNDLTPAGSNTTNRESKSSLDNQPLIIVREIVGG